MTSIFFNFLAIIKVVEKTAWFKAKPPAERPRRKEQRIYYNCFIKTFLFLARRAGFTVALSLAFCFNYFTAVSTVLLIGVSVLGNGLIISLLFKILHS